MECKYYYSGSTFIAITAMLESHSNAFNAVAIESKRSSGQRSQRTGKRSGSDPFWIAHPALIYDCGTPTTPLALDGGASTLALLQSLALVRSLSTRAACTRHWSTIHNIFMSTGLPARLLRKLVVPNGLGVIQQY